MSTTQEIEARIRAFVADIEALVRRDIVDDVRQETLQAVAASLGATVRPAAARPAKAAAAAPARRGRPKGSKNKKKAGRKAAPAAAKAAPAKAAKPAKAPKAVKAKVAKAAPKKAGARKKGEKRTRAELDQIEAALHEYVKANPGLGIEKIGKGMNMPTSELNRPMKKLIAKGSIRFTGEKRATKYFPGSGAAKKAAKSAGRKGRKK